MTDFDPFQTGDEKSQERLSSLLSMLNLGAWQYYPTVGSTNDVAAAWAKEGAPDWSLVIADEQTAGRGRYARRWVTKPGRALAFSLVLCPVKREVAHLPRFTALAALGLIKALEELGLEGQIKWPNDILLAGKKVAGVLVEADWQDGELQSLVLGMGVNVTSDSLPEPQDLRFPAISVSQAKGEIVDRWTLLATILKTMMALRVDLPEDVFMGMWNQHLAFKDHWTSMNFPGKNPALVKIQRISHEGQLIVETKEGEIQTVTAGEIGMPSQL